MKRTDGPPRLTVVAAIMNGESPGAGPLASAARLGCEIHERIQSASAATATPAERALAQALQDDYQRDELPADQAIAELLILADGDGKASKLAAELSQAFLPPDEFCSALASEERRSAFADLYRKLALHELNSQVRNKAAAILFRLTRCQLSG